MSQAATQSSIAPAPWDSWSSKRTFCTATGFSKGEVKAAWQPVTKDVSRDEGGVLWVFSSCGASVGFLTRYDGELREPLMWPQGSQVSMRMARGSVSLLSSYGRGI